MDKKWFIFGAALASFALLTGCKQENRFLGRTVSAWMIELDSDVDYERRAACEALQLAGPEAAPAIPKLIKLLDDVNDGVSAFCATALIKIGPAAVVPLEGVLAEAMEPNLRLHAATSLVRIDSKHARGLRKALGCLHWGRKREDCRQGSRCDHQGKARWSICLSAVSMTNSRQYVCAQRLRCARLASPR